MKHNVRSIHPREPHLAHYLGAWAREVERQVADVDQIDLACDGGLHHVIGRAFGKSKIVQRPIVADDAIDARSEIAAGRFRHVDGAVELEIAMPDR